MSRKEYLVDRKAMLRINLIKTSSILYVMDVAAVQISIRSFPFYYATGPLNVKKGDVVIVPFNGSEVIGEVVTVESRANPYLTHTSYQNIIRFASRHELHRLEEQKKQEKDALEFCRAKVKEHGLAMKVSDVHIDNINRKVTFHFTAPKRIDFRKLVKDLAAHFKSRIELWQIGVRDESRNIDGYGVCGRRLCCASFIKKFEPISVKMARQQDLLIAPSKISGVCGRLMCCLAFEKEMYKELGKDAPPIGAIAKTDEFEAEIIDRNLLMGMYILQDSNGKRFAVSRRDIISVTIPQDIEKIQQKLKEIRDEGAEEELPPDDTEIEEEQEQ